MATMRPRIFTRSTRVIAIEGMEVIAGDLPRRALELVFDWTELHRQELMENWRKAEDHLPLDNIEPLE
jgi:hypothetical protein